VLETEQVCIKCGGTGVTTIVFDLRLLKVINITDIKTVSHIYNTVTLK
jgi:hypothetical protein